MEMWLGVLLMLIFTWRADSDNYTAFNTPYARTSLGLFHGTKVDVHLNPIDVGSYRTVNQFLGIPYAKKPLDSLRFKKPEPAEPFDHIHEAYTMRAFCWQWSDYLPFFSFDTVSEDCLYLNIWTPVQPPLKLPVLFWIPGGGFPVGNNTDTSHDGRVLAGDGGVVVVTVSYRKGLFGFLTSGTEEAPGNYGMYDILEALKWVNQNIEAFGGDPNQVTLGGQGSGSVAVGLLCVSPLTKGLFHRVIMQSGSPAYTLADNSTSDSVSLSQSLAKAAECADDNRTIYNDPNGVISCLRGKHAASLLYTMFSLLPRQSLSFFPRYGDEILPMNARTALFDGVFENVPVLIGNNHDEAAFLLTTDNSDLFCLYGENDVKFNKSFGEFLLNYTFSNIYSFPDPEAVIAHYLGDVLDIQENLIRHQVYTAMGDYRFLCPSVFFAESYSASDNNVHYYYFTHTPDKSPWARWMGAVHYDEVQFVFGQPYTGAIANGNQYFSADEYLLSKTMVAIWTNFVKTGSPGVHDWPSYSRASPVYMKLSTDQYAYKDRFQRFNQGPHKENCDFFRTYFGFE